MMDSRKKKNDHLDGFAVFILSHGRPDNIKTINALKRQGYTGKMFIVIDDEDQTSEKYHINFPGTVIEFSKKEIAKTFDIADNFNGAISTSYVRNAFWGIAKTLGLKYFLQLDDDYTDFRLERMHGKKIVFTKNLNALFAYFTEYLTSCPESVKSICFAQTGDFIGGEENQNISGDITASRKAMNSFFCMTERPFTFIGRMNEDVNTYVKHGNVGMLFFTVYQVALLQVQTQSSKGGMTDAYLESGTYVKSFYTVMLCPSAVKIGQLIGPLNTRIHHSISWDKAVPLILDESTRKQA